MKKENIYTDEERYWMTGGNDGTLPTRIIPSEIYSLAPNEVFVFGSNALGMHHYIIILHSDIYHRKTLNQSLN